MPPDYVLALLPLEVLGVISVLAAVVWLVTRILAPAARVVLKAARDLLDLLDDWKGRPERPGHDAEPGVMERLRHYDQRIEGLTSALEENTGRMDRQDAALEEVRHHVQPNSGTSAYDILRRDVTDLRGMVAEALADLSWLHRALRHNHPDYDPDMDYPGDSDDY